MPDFDDKDLAIIAITLIAVAALTVAAFGKTIDPIITNAISAIAGMATGAALTAPKGP